MTVKVTVGDTIPGELMDDNPALMALLFSGDRFACCDEFMIATAVGRAIGVASIAPTGEGTGEPTIVGLFVASAHRRQGAGMTLMQMAIDRCQARGLTPVRVDIMSTAMRQLAAKIHKIDHARAANLRVVGGYGILDALS